jgi:hypothetical protein
MTTLDLIHIMHAPPLNHSPHLARVCPLCLNRGFILTNGGTGLLRRCPAKCDPQTPIHPKP